VAVHQQPSAGLKLDKGRAKGVAVHQQPSAGLKLDKGRA